MEFAQLPNEILLAIASYLNASEICALLKTSRGLNDIFHDILYYFDGRYNQACALPYAVKYNHIANVQALLDGLRSAPRRYHTSTLPPCCHELTVELEECSL